MAEHTAFPICESEEFEDGSEVVLAGAEAADEGRNDGGTAGEEHRPEVSAGGADPAEDHRSDIAQGAAPLSEGADGTETADDRRGGRQSMDGP